MGKNTIEVSCENILSFRFKRNYLAKRVAKSKFIEVMRHLGGLQSQIQSCAYTSVWARVEKITIADIEKALINDKTIVRNWSIRGTLHLMYSDFYKLFLSIVGKSNRSSFEKIAKCHDLDLQTTKQVINFIRESLKNGPKTRREVSKEITDLYGVKIGQLIKDSWGAFFHYCAGMGYVCFGPNKGAETTFVLCKNWLNKNTEQTFENPIMELARLYLKAYGPASLYDFSFWSGFKTIKLKQAWYELDTTEVQVEDKMLNVLKEDFNELASSKPKGVIRLLPNFDVYLLSTKEKNLYLEKPNYKKVYKTAGWIAQTVIEDGKVIGLWHKEHKGKYLTIKIEPFAQLTATKMDQIEKEALSFGDFFDKKIRINIEKPI